MSLRPRKIVESLPVYIPAKSIESAKKEYGFEKVIKLAGNENTLGFSPAAFETLSKITSYYPDGEALNVREKLAEKHDVKTENIIFGNGSFELLTLIGLAFLEENDESVIAVPSFGWYRNVTLIMGGKIVEVPLEDYKVNLDKISEAVTDKTKIIWLCNPNNPTGTIFTKDELNVFLKKIRNDIVVVLDEAYADFVNEPGYPDSIKLLDEYSNIIILRTFSKLEGLAGFRAGYGVAGRELIGYLNKVRMPINTNAAAQLAAVAAIEDETFKSKVIENVHEGLKLYYETFDKWKIPYVKSNTNFIFFDTGKDSEWLTKEFLKRGILIRAGKEFGYPTHLRISIGTTEENEEVIRLLGELLEVNESEK